MSPPSTAVVNSCWWNLRTFWSLKFQVQSMEKELLLKGSTWQKRQSASHVPVAAGCSSQVIRNTSQLCYCLFQVERELWGLSLLLHLLGSSSFILAVGRKRFYACVLPLHKNVDPNSWKKKFKLSSCIFCKLLIPLVCQNVVNDCMTEILLL